MGAEPLTDAEVIRRTRICLFEVGYHDIDIQAIGRHPDGTVLLGTGTDIKEAVGYQVGVLLCQSETRPICCWSCWRDSWQIALDCQDGNCHHPEGPARPPREELLGTP